MAEAGCTLPCFMALTGHECWGPQTSARAKKKLEAYAHFSSGDKTTSQHHWLKSVRAVLTVKCSFSPSNLVIFYWLNQHHQAK